MAGFSQKLDIQNRAIYHLGGVKIGNINEVSKNNSVTSDAYDALLFTEQERNRWRFGIKKAPLRAVTTTTLLFVPDAWNSTINYLPGEIVSDSNGVYWVSLLPDNLNNTPGMYVVGQPQFWDQYFGPVTADVWNNPNTTFGPGSTPPTTIAQNPLVNSASYYAGEICYMFVNGPGGLGGPDAGWNGGAGISGAMVAFYSRYNNNLEQPTITDAWSATNIYNQDDVVLYNNQVWRSTLPQNLNNTPAEAPSNWSATLTYAIGVTVTGYDGFVYQALRASLTNIDPVQDAQQNNGNWGIPTNGGPLLKAWTRLPLPPYATATPWVPLRGKLVNIVLTYPIGTGPTVEDNTRNIYRLPNGFLRIAPQDPSAGRASILGSPSNTLITDWTEEGDYMTSRYWETILYRFQAKVTDVTKMANLFCEMLALRIAMDCCEAITQSTEKMNELTAKYKAARASAVAVNGIEVGNEEPPLDDFIACRI